MTDGDAMRVNNLLRRQCYSTGDVCSDRRHNKDTMTSRRTDDSRRRLNWPFATSYNCPHTAFTLTDSSTTSDWHSSCQQAAGARSL